jgi:hypothetical protein
MATTEVGIKISAKDDTAGAFGTINAGLGRLQSTATSVSGSLAALGIGLSAGAFVAFTKNIINGIDALNDLKDATGASIENLSALEDIARRTGTGFDTVGTSLVKLNQALSNAKPGSDTERALTAIGLSVKDLKALDPAEAFRQIAVGLSGFADDANKARLTQELFGKSLREVAPLLKDVAEQGRLVATVTSEQAAEAEKFNKELFALQKTTTDLSRAFVSDLLPSLNALAREMAAAKKTSSGFWDGFITQLVQNPFKSAGENAAKYREELDDLTAARNRYIKSGSDTVAIDQAIATMQRRLAYFTELEGNATAKASAGGGRGSINPALVLPSVADIGELSAAATAAKKAGDDAARAAEAQAKAYKSLIAGISEKIAANKLEAESGQKLTEAQKEELAIRKLVEQGTISQADANSKNTKELLAQLAASEAQAEQTAKTAKATADAAAARLKFNETLGSGLEKLQQEVKTQQEYNDRLGLSKTAIAELDAAKLNDQATTLEGLAIKALDRNLDTEQYNLYKAQAEELRKLAKLKKDGAAKETGLEELKKTQEEAKKFGDDLERIITDGLMRGFENGKSIAENFRDVLENTFKTLILRPVIQATVQGVLGTDGGAGGIGGGVSGFLGGLQKAGKAFESASFALTDFQGFAAFQAKDLGDALSKAGFEKSGDFIAGNANEIGNYVNKGAVALSYLEAVSNFKDGTYGQSIGQAIGTAWAGPIGGQIGKALGGIADRIFGGDQGPTAVGVNSSFDAQGNLVSRVKSGGTSNAEVDQFTSLLGASYQQILTKFGATGKASTFGFQKTSDGFFDVSANVGGSGVFQQGRTAYSEGALQLASSRAIFAALQASELPQYLSKAFTGIVANTASADQINGALAFADSLKSIRFGLLSATEQQAEYQKIIDASTASLGTSAATFKTDFIAAIDEGLTPEGLAQWSSLGATMQALEQITGKTNETLRSAADIANERKNLEERYAQATLSTEQLAIRAREAIDGSNRARFDEVIAAEAAKTATEKLKQEQEDLANAAKAAADALKATNDSLQDRLDVLTGAQTDRGLQLRDATDATTKALLNQIFAQEDLRAATEKAAQAAQQAIDKARGQQQSISQRYASPLTEQSAAALLPPDIAAQIGTVSGKVIRDTVFDYVNALDPLSASGQAALTALEKMTPALDFFAARADAIAAERATLQQQLDELTLSSTAKLENQRNALDESNRALFDQVQAQLAIKSASEEAARSLESFKAAMASLATQRGSLQVQLLTAQGRPADALALKRKTDLDVLLEGRTGLDAERLKASFNANVALEDEIERTNQAAEAARAMAAAQAEAARAAQQAADQLKAAWQSATDAIFDEVRRIRGITGAGSAQSFASAQAQFSITAAQASAGDQEAAKALPTLSRILLELAEQSATSIVQLRSIQGVTAGTLEGIAKQYIGQFSLNVPKLATGTNFVPADMLAVVHKGEAIIPAAYNPNNGSGSNNDAMLSEMQAMRLAIQTLQAAAERTATATANSDKTLTRVTRGGDAMQTQVFV